MRGRNWGAVLQCRTGEQFDGMFHGHRVPHHDNTMRVGWLGRLRALDQLIGRLLGVQKMGDLWVVKPKRACTVERVPLLGWDFRLGPSADDAQGLERCSRRGAMLQNWGAVGVTQRDLGDLSQCPLRHV